MKKKTIFSLVVTFVTLCSFAQQFPVGSCGIVNHYDAAGNRIRR